MSRLGKFVVVAAVINFFGLVLFYSHRTNLTQLLTLPIIPLFFATVVISFVCIASEWRHRGWLCLIPFAACVLSVVLAIPVVEKLRHAIFIRSLPSYEAVVQQIETGSIPVSTNTTSLPQAVSQARLAYAVLAQKDTDGVLTVVFFTEGGFPVRHSGYLYCSSGVIAPGSFVASRWSVSRQEKPRWFGFSD